MTDKSSLLTDATNYAQWLRLLQVRAMHGRHLLAPEVQLMTSVGVTTTWCMGTFSQFVFVVDWDYKKILPITHQFYGYMQKGIEIKSRGKSSNIT